MSGEEPSFWKKYEGLLVAGAIGLGTSVLGTVIARRVEERSDYDDDDDGDDEDFEY